MEILTLPQDVRDEIDWYNERAGIREFDGGQDRLTAERLATVEYREWKGLPRD